MSNVNAKLYEGMFLVNQQAAAGDFATAIEHVQQILNRAGAEIVVLHKWDERKLAYPIKSQKRGLYIYALFNVEGVQLANIERDCNLSELVMRELLLRADYMGEVEIELAKQQAQVKSTETQLRSDDDADETSDDEGSETVSVDDADDVDDDGSDSGDDDDDA